MKSSNSIVNGVNPTLEMNKARGQKLGRLAALLGLTLVAGCTISPNYQRPTPLGENPIPATFGDPAIANSTAWKTAQPAAGLPRGNWWELYGDPELNRLESLTASENQQLAVALANFTQARAAAKISEADVFPQATGAATATRQRTSANTTAKTSNTFNTFNLTANASWEVDLWGRVHQEIAGAQARLTASADDLESLRLSLQAEVAIDYFTLRALDAQAELLDKTIASYQQALEVTTNRRNNGVASELDVSQAETQLKSAQAQVPVLDLQRGQLRHALAVLCGQVATSFAVAPSTAEATNPPEIPIAIPSELLESRPDIAAAERRMAAANADIGLAKAAYYPKVQLIGTAGLESISTSNLFDLPSRLWALGPSLQVPIFNGGKNQAQLNASKAAYDGTVATYRQTVLAAFQEVEDQLATQLLLSRQLDEEEAALKAAQHTLDISTNRYQAGVGQYLDVISAQATQLTHRQRTVQLGWQRLSASVSLIKSLGSGWNNADKTPKNN